MVFLDGFVFSRGRKPNIKVIVGLFSFLFFRKASLEIVHFFSSSNLRLYSIVQEVMARRKLGEQNEINIEVK